jgi:hypothetical protein
LKDGYWTNKVHRKRGCQFKKGVIKTLSPEYALNFERASTDTLQMIIDLVTQSYCKFEPCTIDSLLDRIECLADVSASPDTMWQIIQKMPQIKIVDGNPMEKTRVRASLQAIRECCQKLGMEIQGVPRDFVVNMDETGCADFVDARKEQVLVPAEYPRPTIPIPLIEV